MCHPADTRQIEPTPNVWQRRAWIKPLLFLLFVGTFFLTEPEAQKDFSFAWFPSAAVNQTFAYDQGFEWLFAGWLHLIKGWKTGQPVSGDEYLLFQAVVLFIFAALMLLPKVPLTVNIGGLITLLAIWLTFGEISSAGHAIEAWSVAFGAMFIAALGYWKGTRKDYVVAACFGVVMGFFPFMRRSAMQTPAACYFLLGIIVMAAAVNRFLQWRMKAEHRNSASASESTPNKEHRTRNTEQGTRNWKSP